MLFTTLSALSSSASHQPSTPSEEITFPHHTQMLSLVQTHWKTEFARYPQYFKRIWLTANILELRSAIVLSSPVLHHCGKSTRAKQLKEAKIYGMAGGFSRHGPLIPRCCMSIKLASRAWLVRFITNLTYDEESWDHGFCGPLVSVPQIPQNQLPVEFRVSRGRQPCLFTLISRSSE